MRVQLKVSVHYLYLEKLMPPEFTHSRTPDPKKDVSFDLKTKVVTAHTPGATLWLSMNLPKKATVLEN